MHRLDLTNKIFNKLTGVQDMSYTIAGRRVWLFKCECGKSVELPCKSVVSGNTKSCGCLQTETRRTNGTINKKHGHAKTADHPSSPTYNSWFSMKYRCKSKKATSFYMYGAVGISYDPRWELFENFLADMGERPAGTTLDRKDGTKGYSKGNCRWATHQEQADNKPRTRKFSYFNEYYTITDISKKFNISRERVKYYLTEKMYSVEKMLEKLNG